MADYPIKSPRKLIEVALPLDAINAACAQEKSIRHGHPSTQAPAGSMMSKDQLCEVGCPYVVRGFDFDHVGLLWLEDLVWRKDRWIAQPEHVYLTGIKRLVSAAKREHDLQGPAHQRLLQPVQQAYRILLTRAIKGLSIWCTDPETASHLRPTFASEGS
jgi:DUF2075 family protein